MNLSKLNGIAFKNNEEVMTNLKNLYVEDIQEYIKQCGDDKHFPFDANNQWVCLTSDPFRIKSKELILFRRMP